MAKIGLKHHRIGADRGGRPFRDLGAVVEHGNCVGSRHDEIDGVLDQQHRNPHLSRQTANELDQLRAHGWRQLPAGVMAAVAVLAIAVPRSGIAPELSPQLRALHEINLTAYWHDLPSLPPAFSDAPSVRKRVGARDKPARMIDDALRRRAVEAVGRALATTESPPT